MTEIIELNQFKLFHNVVHQARLPASTFVELFEWFLIARKILRS